MKAMRLLVAMLATVGLLLALNSADAADDAQQQKGKRPQAQKGQAQKFQLQKGQLQKGLQQLQQFQLPFGRGGALLTAEGIEKLKLTAEQKEKFDKINTEYQDKAKAAGEKLREALQNKDAQALQNLRTDGQKLRDDYLAKVEPILTAEQKKIFEEVKAQRPGIGGFGRPGGGGNPGQVLSSGVQTQLKLTDEQKKKLEELQKEVDNKLNSIFTEEQRKQFEEIKKGGPPRVRPNIQP
jgi:Spy/CpxP family protein refolding chaperone